MRINQCEWSSPFAAARFFVIRFFVGIRGDIVGAFTCVVYRHKRIKMNYYLR